MYYRYRCFIVTNQIPQQISKCEELHEYTSVITQQILIQYINVCTWFAMTYAKDLDLMETFALLLK